MITALIFDVGGVLIRTEEWRQRWQLEDQIGLARGGADELVFNSEMGTQAQLGLVSDEQLWSWVGLTLELSIEQLELFRRQFWAGDRIDDELISTIRDLKMRYQTAIISNATDALRHTLEANYKCADAFDLIVCSAEEQVMKPAEEIYRRALARLQCSPEETIFVDDSPPNVQAARRLGMKAILFTPSTDWKAALSDAGVELSDEGEAGSS